MANDGPEREAEEIRKLDAAWGAAASAGDLEQVLGFYATDGTLVWPGAPAAHGSDEIRANWRELIATTPGLRLEFLPERVVVSGDGTLASDFGTVRFGHDKSQWTRLTEIGKYVVVWRKEDQGWKVLYDSYNMNEDG